MNDNEKVTRFLKSPINHATKEPLAEVMVIDGMSSEIGGGVEKFKTIVAGDLVKVDKMVILHHLFVESSLVAPAYFDDFITKKIDPFDEKQEEKVVPKVEA